MAKTYYVDSENVGDCWIDLMNNEDDSNFLVFYTERSPRIDYGHAISLMNVEKKPEFIHCYEGNNALDFQLVSYLGYLLHLEEPEEVIIVSNDTGFDAAVNFWVERGVNIKRLATNCVQAEKESEISEEPVSSDDIANHQIVDVNAKLHGVEKKDLYTVINCMGASNTSDIHLVFVHLFGRKKGEEIYKHMKAEKFHAPSVAWKRSTKVKKFVELIVKYCNTAKVSVPSDVVSFLCSAITSSDGKKSMQKKMNEHYGNNAAPVHQLFQPFYKVIAKIE